MLTAPVIYILFNRPDMVRRTFPAIRAQRPARLYLVADGPRPARPADAERCAETRATVESMIDWECEVTRDYSEVNLGAGKRIATGLTKALAQLGEAIVLEDDILPHPDFFAFCTEALARYRDNPQIHGISGYNPIGRYLPRERRAVPARTHITWGWATWNRAWQNYRGQLEGWDDPSVKSQIREYIGNDLYFGELERAFKAVQERTVDAWDYQWVYTMLHDRRYGLVSSVNLIENLGFVADATHTFQVPAFAKGLKSHPLPASSWPSPDDAPDRLFDHLYWLVMLSSSCLKLTVLRQFAQTNRWLLETAVKPPTGK